MIISVHNHKGGLGKTTTSAHLAFRANEHGISTLAVTLDRQGDLLRWFSDGNPDLVARKPVQYGQITGLYSPEKMPPRDITRAFQLTIIDTPPQAYIVDIVNPDLWTVPVDNRTGIENLATIIPLMAKKAPNYVVFYGSDEGGEANLRGLQEAARTIPRLEFHPEVIPRHGAIFRAQSYYLPVWRTPRGKDTKGHTAMERLCDAILVKAGLISPRER